MRTGGLWRFAVLASLALLVSGQLCMLTTCVPRLARSQAATAHHCCSTDGGSPAAPAPMGAMPCSQMSNLAESASLDAPAPQVVMFVVPVLARIAVPEPVAMARAHRETWPRPGLTGPAPAGLRAPPIA